MVQPRTNKRQVLFTADLPKPGEPWLFILNPELVWDDISMDTKLRLKNLPDEAVSVPSTLEAPLLCMQDVQNWAPDRLDLTCLAGSCICAQISKSAIGRMGGQDTKVPSNGGHRNHSGPSG